MEEKVKAYFEAAPEVNEVWSCGGKLWISESAAESCGLGEVKKHSRAKKGGK